MKLPNHVTRAKRALAAIRGNKSPQAIRARDEWGAYLALSYQGEVDAAHVALAWAIQYAERVGMSVGARAE